MNTQRLLLIAVVVSLVGSVAATLASYNFYYTDPFIVDASFLYRGWPLCWVVESWSGWSPRQQPHSLSFQPSGFLADVFFWAAVLQFPSAALLLAKSRRRQLPSNLPDALLISDPIQKQSGTELVTG